MNTVKVYIVREKDGTYSSYMDENANLPYGLVGEGDTVQEVIDEWMASYNDMRELFAEQGQKFVEAKFVFTYDVPSFLKFYGGRFTFSGLSKVTGVSAAQLSHYANGYRRPSRRTTAKIESALHAFGAELTSLQLV